MTLMDVEQAVLALEAQGVRPTERNILTHIGQGSRRDVGKFLHLLRADGRAPGITPGGILAPETYHEQSADAAPYEPGGVPEPDADDDAPYRLPPERYDPDGPEQDPWDQEQETEDDQPPAPRTVPPPRPRHTPGAEVCSLCDEDIPLTEAVATVLSCLPSVQNIEFGMRPLRQAWHPQCLVAQAQNWNAHHPDTIKEGNRP